MCVSVYICAYVAAVFRGKYNLSAGFSLYFCYFSFFGLSRFLIFCDDCFFCFVLSVDLYDFFVRSKSLIASLIFLRCFNNFYKYS